MYSCRYHRYNALNSPQRFCPLDVKWGNEYAEVKFDEICWEFGEDLGKLSQIFEPTQHLTFTSKGRHLAYPAVKLHRNKKNWTKHHPHYRQIYLKGASGCKFRRGPDLLPSAPENFPPNFARDFLPVQWGLFACLVGREAPPPPVFAEI